MSNMVRLNCIIQVQGETYVRFTPQDKDFCNHPEELCGVCVRLLEPPGPGWNNMKYMKYMKYWNMSNDGTLDACKRHDSNHCD